MLQSRAMRSLSILLLGGLAGCQLFQPQPQGGTAYPSTPPAAKGTPTANPVPPTLPTTVPTVVKVPAGAQILSSGDYPPPSFAAPKEAGMIEVVDLDGDPTVAVATTSVTSSDGTKQMSITDVTNMSANLDRTHKYKIVFVPLTTPAAATAP